MEKMTLGVRWSLVSVLCALVVGTFGTACSLDDAIEWGRARFVERHRKQAHGKVGVLRALEISDSATRVTRAIDWRGDAECGVPPEGPYEATLTVLMEVVHESSRDVATRLEETRTIRVDAQGSVSVVSSVAFQDAATQRGVSTREVRWIDHQLYTREHNAPFVVRHVHQGSREDILRRAFDPIASVLTAGKDTWVLDVTSAPGSYIAGPGSPEGPKRALSCGLPAKDRAWLLRVLMRGDIELAQAFLGRDSRGLGARNASLRLLSSENGRKFVVRVDVDEIIERPSTDIEPIKPPDEIADIQRDRPFEDIKIILEKKLKIQEWGKLPPLDKDVIPPEPLQPSATPQDGPEPTKPKGSGTSNTP